MLFQSAAMKAASRPRTRANATSIESVTPALEQNLLAPRREPILFRFKLRLPQLNHHSDERTAVRDHMLMGAPHASGASQQQGREQLANQRSGPVVKIAVR
jgi:hypothetical protein